jgi:hypothetical protein
VRGARDAHVRDEPAADDENGLLADEAERVERVDDCEHRVHRLVQLAAGHDLERRGQAVVLEVRADARAVQPEHGLVRHDERAAPLLVHGEELRALGREDVVDEVERVVDVLDALGAHSASVAWKQKRESGRTRTSNPFALRETLAVRSEAIGGRGGERLELERAGVLRVCAGRGTHRSSRTHLIRARAPPARRGA